MTTDPDFTLTNSKRDSWQARYQDPEQPGKYHRVVLFSRTDSVPKSKRTKAEANRRAPEAVRKHWDRLRLERAVSEGIGEDNVQTIQDWLEISRTDPGVKGSVSEDTRDRRDKTLRAFVIYLEKKLKLSPGMSVTVITRKVIERWKVDRAEGKAFTPTGKPSQPCNPSSVLRELTVIKRAFNFCIRTGAIPGMVVNPAAHVNVYLGMTKAAQIKDREDKSMPLERLEELLDYSKDFTGIKGAHYGGGTDQPKDCAPVWMYPFILTMAHTGMRPGECRNLLWEGWKRKGANVIAMAKGKSGHRQVVLNPTVVEALEEWKERLQGWGMLTEFVFVNGKGTRISRNVLNVAWNRLQKRVWGEDVETLPPYSIRHCYAHALADKAPIHVVKTALGHKSITTTELYLGQEVEQVADQIAGALS